MTDPIGTAQSWWMIERTDLEPSPHYFAWKYRPEQLPPHGSHTWTPDWQLGERFPTKEAAEAHTNGDPNLRVCDHCMMQTEAIGTAQERELIAAIVTEANSWSMTKPNRAHKLREAADALLSRIAEGERLTARVSELEETSAERVMKALWPLLGGNHTEAELWHEIGDAVSAALSQQRRP